MQGIDVHGDKGPVDWQKVKAAGRSFAWVKATEGLTFDDARFSANRSGAANAGLHVGAYHFARPDLHPGTSGALAEAQHFVSRVGRVKVGELRPALDFEHPPASADWALAWLAAVEKALGIRPVFYTYPAFLAEMARHADLAKYPLWFASYGPNDGKRHPASVPAGFDMVVQQYTSNGSVPGVAGDVDLNYADSLAPIVKQRPKPWKLVKDSHVYARGTYREMHRWIKGHAHKVSKLGGINLRRNK